MKPSYLSLSDREFERIIEKLWNRLKACDLCGNGCGVNRLEGERGKCNSGERLKVSSANLHFGEEDPLVGQDGSGAIFLSNCPMECVYCQNWRISQRGRGEEKTEEEMADMIIQLQERGAQNINWVTPTHYVPQLVKSLRKASEKGLELPVVYNTGGYDSPEIIEILDGIVDIYMPDVKYGSNENGEKYSRVENYWDIVRKNLREMHRQVGDLKLNENGIAERGLLIRHLVLPNQISESEKVLEYIAGEISKDSYVNIMNQYHPRYKAKDYEELKETITRDEFLDVLQSAEDLGLHRGFQ